MKNSRHVQGVENGERKMREESQWGTHSHLDMVFVGWPILTCHHHTAESCCKCELIQTSVLETNYDHT